MNESLETNRKRVLIISPYFVPVNSADMQRVRMSLPFFGKYGWDAEVVAVSPEFCDFDIDMLLLESIPKDSKIHLVRALSKRWTSKLGLGSIALRSLPYYFSVVNKLLSNRRFDLVYFSTTQFPVCILGAYWKKRFGIPYVIDMQDPWHSDFYKNKPKAERPPKYWFMYHLHKVLERVAMIRADGIISVSDAYIETLRQRYKNIRRMPAKVITFGYSDVDFKIVERHVGEIRIPYGKNPAKKHLVYIGRGGNDMLKSITLLLSTFQRLLLAGYPGIDRLHFHFIGTSYAAKGEGKPTFTALGEQLGISGHITENPARVSFYESIRGILAADALIIPGSEDRAYTASKIYPYILAKRPLLAMFHKSSSAYKIIQDCRAGTVLNLEQEELLQFGVADFLKKLLSEDIAILTSFKQFEQFSADEMTKSQCMFFEKVIEHTR